MELPPKTVEKIVSAICVLHNFLMSQTQSAPIYAPRGTFDVENEDGTVTPGNWRTEANVLEQLDTSTQRNATVSAKKIREEFKDYFCREGQVSWQCNFV